MTTLRHVLAIQAGQPASDGAGVRLNRVIGGAGLERFDPFLMLDEFSSDDPDDYIAGFPSHPHRGFETVTYMLEGRMRHQDHLGNVGELEPGGVQWMTAARGIIHSEMPMQEQGVMRGFQLWLNLPAQDKLGEPGYRDIPAAQIPEVHTEQGVTARVIAGQFDEGQQSVAGAVQRLYTEPQLFDLQMSAGSQLAPRLAQGLRVMLYVYEGQLQLPGHHAQAIPAGRLVRLSDSGELHLASSEGARVLLIAGRPLHEPIVQYGPFVMNTREEVEQALRDFRDGTLA
ncbi:MAG: pirin family protein [Gammaproteobacteria bacterium]|nr:pirin family protein [Gammaproteobacteria bacterium]MBU1490351.1 pirin family protein [Gammaproteobacteria bacterium]MBU2064650.1 pirin family protein [Gammaproteobacteria bacterium]MBU2138648.1 pirin family protein [Gammaproteobacteria bacterium]MBU2217004.1 pirin family protein [Gammaproteobacteria bacterium]